MTDAGYFDDLYADDADPWRLASSAYEQRKLALLLAALPRARYRSAFEPGCAIGVTTTALAARCDRLLAVDGAAAAVVQARARVGAGHVAIEQGRIPRDWPAHSFDLVVLSEVLYYLASRDRRRVATLARRCLLPGGDLVAVHWRPAFDEAPTNGDLVHAELAQRLADGGLDQVVDHVEEQFRLQVFHAPRGSTLRRPR